MITVFDMETGETLERYVGPTVSNHILPKGPCKIDLLDLGLQEVPLPPPAVQMPPDLAALDIVEFLAQYW